MRSTVPVIDLFAGPGGLGEGFCSFRPEGRVNRAYRIILSVEKDPYAHRTLELRSFFRQFSWEVPDEYYKYLQRKITRNELFSCFPFQSWAARNEAMLAELGKDDNVIYERITQRLARVANRPWILVGGPPCQAYSVVGRSRRKDLTETDDRQVLYQEYLKIIARFQPAVFVMENVKGLLSSQARLDENAKPHLEGTQERIFQRILRDLKRPVQAVREVDKDWNEAPAGSEALAYRIFSLVERQDNPDNLEPADYIIRSEEYAIPQTRHRLILLGIRGDIRLTPDVLSPSAAGRVTVESVIDTLPRLRSQLSKRVDQDRDSPENWKQAVHQILHADWLQNTAAIPRAPENLSLFEDERQPDRIQELCCCIRTGAEQVLADVGTGGEYIRCSAVPAYRPDWFWDERLRGVCNHTGRAHMVSDLHRYLFLSCYARIHGTSPTMRQFPASLLPAHENVRNRKPEHDRMFEDRFRVQVKGKPATTITSHISKDGHYNVHYDPAQCRSLTVREAARIQTFPDNYLFEGPRTEQYQQVGNAVPPLLAQQIARVVYDLFERLHAGNR